MDECLTLIQAELQKAEKDLQEAIRLEKEAKAKEGTILWWTAQIRLDERIKTLKELLRRIKKDQKRWKNGIWFYRLDV